MRTGVGLLVGFLALASAGAAMPIAPLPSPPSSEEHCSASPTGQECVWTGSVRPGLHAGRLTGECEAATCFGFPVGIPRAAFLRADLAFQVSSGLPVEDMSLRFEASDGRVLARSDSDALWRVEAVDYPILRGEEGTYTLVVEAFSALQGSFTLRAVLTWLAEGESGLFQAEPGADLLTDARGDAVEGLPGEGAEVLDVLGAWAFRVHADYLLVGLRVAAWGLPPIGEAAEWERLLEVGLRVGDTSEALDARSLYAQLVRTPAGTTWGLLKSVPFVNAPDGPIYTGIRVEVVGEAPAEIRWLVPLHAAGDPSPDAPLGNLTGLACEMAKNPSYPEPFCHFRATTDLPNGDNATSGKVVPLGLARTSVGGAAPPRATRPPGPAGDAPDGPALTGFLAAAGLPASLLAATLLRRGLSKRALDHLGPLQPGDVLRGHRVERLVGEGAYGRVLLAHDRDGREVVLKEPHPASRADPEVREVFEREAEVGRRVRHPNLVVCHGLLEDRGRWALAMEHVPGGTLEQRLRRDGPLPWPEALWLTEGLLAGLEALHAQGVLHRDLKAANVLLAPDGSPRLADFGVARLPDAARTLRCADGSQPGSLETMSPEQALGRAVGARADLYAATALLYRAMTGVHYLDLRGMPLGEVRAAIAVRKPALPLPGAPPQVNALLARGLAKAPQDRFESASAMRAAVRNALPAGEVRAARSGTAACASR